MRNSVLETDGRTDGQTDRQKKSAGVELRFAAKNLTSWAKKNWPPNIGVMEQIGLKGWTSLGQYLICLLT